VATDADGMVWELSYFSKRHICRETKARRQGGACAEPRDSYPEMGVSRLRSAATSALCHFPQAEAGGLRNARLGLPPEMKLSLKGTRHHDSWLPSGMACGRSK